VFWQLLFDVGCLSKNLRAKKREGPRISEPTEWVSQFSWKKNKQIVLKLQKSSATHCSVVHELESEYFDGEIPHKNISEEKFSACLKKLGTLCSGCNQQNKDRFNRARRKIFKILDPEGKKKKGFGWVCS
jgi:hypothetical protein